MKIGLTAWVRRFGFCVLSLGIAGLLAACGANQATVAPAPTASTPAVSTTSSAPTAPAQPSTATSVPIAATSTAGASAPATEPATNTAPAATVTLARPTASPANGATATPDPAVAAVLAYLEARARTDAAAATGLSCKAWISKALTEVTSFRSMNAKLVGVTCQVTGSASGFTLVGCGGKMVTTYGTETRDWDLSSFVYQVILEGGQWKMCGYH